jgi:hypothetical protein
MFVFHPVLVERRDSEKLQGGRPRDRHSIAGKGKKPLLQRSLTGCSTHTVFCPMGNGDFLPGIRRPGPETDHFLPSSSEVNNDGSYFSLSLSHVLMSWTVVTVPLPLLLANVSLSEYY